MNQMQQLLLDAAAAHPERAEYDRAIARGLEPARAARLLSPQGELTLKHGASTWYVRNDPQRLEAHAEAVAKCPGFTGRKTPRPRVSKGSGVLYQHVDGFRLFIPDGMIFGKESELLIGTRKFTLHHKHRTITGSVPESWLVDLNAGPIGEERDEEELVPGWDLI
jgi:hypothetical protein